VAYKVGYGVLYGVLWVLATPFRISHKRDEARKAAQPAEHKRDAAAETGTDE